MASANNDNREAAGILRLLMGMAAAAAPASALPRGGGLMMVQHVILDVNGELFSGGVGGGGVPPASKAAIAALKEVKAGEGEDALGECAICLDAVEGTGKEMPCGHRFHGRCLERWLGVHGNCPVCRRELPAPAKEEEEDSAASAEGGEEERRRPRAAVVVSYLVFGGGRAEAQQEPEREEPWNIRIEDVD